MQQIIPQQKVRADQIGVSCKCGKTLIRRIAIAGWAKRQYLPELAARLQPANQRTERQTGQGHLCHTGQAELVGCRSTPDARSNLHRVFVWFWIDWPALTYNSLKSAWTTSVPISAPGSTTSPAGRIESLADQRQLNFGLVHSTPDAHILPHVYAFIEDRTFNHGAALHNAICQQNRLPY